MTRGRKVYGLFNLLKIVTRKFCVLRSHLILFSAIGILGYAAEVPYPTVDQ